MAVGWYGGNVRRAFAKRRRKGFSRLMEAPLIDWSPDVNLCTYGTALGIIFSSPLARASLEKPLSILNFNKHWHAKSNQNNNKKHRVLCVRHWAGIFKLILFNVRKIIHFSTFFSAEWMKSWGKSIQNTENGFRLMLGALSHTHMVQSLLRHTFSPFFGTEERAGKSGNEYFRVCHTRNIKIELQNIFQLLSHPFPYFSHIKMFYRLRWRATRREAGAGKRHKWEML